MLTPEGRVKAKVKKQLDTWRVYHFWPVQTGYGAATVDCLACVFLRSPEFWGIEVKREGVDKPTKRQVEVMRQIRAAGGRTFLVTMKDDELVWGEIK